jgi:flavin-dependent thymidylate synthase
LFDYTGKGSLDPARAAANILAFTKSTRLSLDEDLMQKIEAWPQEKIDEELRYMAKTIPSSWEFVHYSFLLDGVTRAFTAQLCRTRTASFAEKTLRVLDVSEGFGWEYGVGPTIADDPLRSDLYSHAMKSTADSYKLLIQHGAKIEDARGVLPLNIKTRICVSMNMRTFVELVRKRSSSRTQGEYRDVLEAMKTAVKAKHDWIGLFLERDFDNAANELNHLLLEVSIPAEQKTHMIKLIDIMREQS